MKDITNQYYYPKDIYNLISRYIQEKGYKTGLDPFPGWNAAILESLVINKKVKEGIVITNNPKQKESSDLINKSVSGNLQIILGDNQLELGKIDKQFDVIVCLPPYGLKREIKTIKADHKEIQINDSLEYVILFTALQKLKQQGEAILVLPNNFFIRQNPNNFRNSLDKCGFYLNSVIRLYPSAFGPITSIIPNIVTISRKDYGNVFIAKYYRDFSLDEFVKGWLERKPNKKTELGLLVKDSELHDVDSSITQEQVKKDLGAYPYNIVKLEKIVKECYLGSHVKDIDSFVNAPNSIYIPSIGNSPVVTKLSQFKIKPQNYIQIVLNQDKALAEFISGFLNTPLGIKLRDLNKGGAFILKMNKTTVLNIPIPLPSLSVQTEVVNTDNDIVQRQTILTEVQKRLWNYPGRLSSVKQDLVKINQGDDCDFLIRQLPFPIASILRRFYADDQPEKKLDYLIFYFEALTELLTTVMLSAYYYDENAKEEIYDLLKTEEDKKALRRTTFGGWAIIASKLAKKIRVTLGKGETEVKYLFELFRTSSIEMIQALTDKDLYLTLEQVSRKRNDWKGHAAPVDDKESQSRVDFLYLQLQKIQENLLGIFSNYELVRSLGMDNKRGIFYTKVHLVTGSDPNFIKKEISIIKALDSTQLYLYEEGQLNALQLLPFVRLMPAPKTELNSCYFYNRTEKDGQRLLSYHYEKESEIVVNDETLSDVINDLTDGKK